MYVLLYFVFIFSSNDTINININNSDNKEYTKSINWIAITLLAFISNGEWDLWAEILEYLVNKNDIIFIVIRRLCVRMLVEALWRPKCK